MGHFGGSAGGERGLDLALNLAAGWRHFGGRAGDGAVQQTPLCRL